MKILGLLILPISVLLVAGTAHAWTYDPQTNRAVHLEDVDDNPYEIGVHYQQGHPYLEVSLSTCCLNGGEAPEVRSAVLVDRGNAIKTVVHHCDIFREYPYVGACADEVRVDKERLTASVKLDRSAVAALRQGRKVGLILWAEGAGKHIAWLSLKGSNRALAALQK
jgi:hypothetical protein